MLDALQPQHVIPAHQDMNGFSDYVDLAKNQGYKIGRDLHLTYNGNIIQIV
jgi:ribonuclease J